MAARSTYRIARILASQNPWDIGTLNPFLGAAYEASLIAVGVNPVDPYTAGRSINEQTFAGGGLPVWQEFGEDTFNSFFGSIYKFKSETREQAIKEFGSLIADTELVPVLGPAIHGLIRVRDSGEEDLEQRKIDIAQQRIERQYSEMGQTIKAHASQAKGRYDFGGLGDAWQEVQKNGDLPKDYRFTDFKARYEAQLVYLHGDKDEKRRYRASGAYKRALDVAGL